MEQELNRTQKTTCPYCGVGCGILATPQQDGSLQIKGDPDHPANYGRLCSKGSALGETISLDGRLLEPHIGDEKASWDEALDLVATKFKDAITQYGPDSVAFYVSGQILTEDYYLANKLMKGFIGSANIDTNSRLCMASSVAGHKRAFGSDTVPGCYEDLELADLIVLVGSNLAWCHPVLYQRIAAAKEARPEMKVVLIDPRRTMTSDIADLHLPIDADGDCALFMGLLQYLVEHDLADQEYVARHTKGFENAIASTQNLSLEKISELTGLQVQQIEQFYTLFAETEKTVTVYSQGVNQSSRGTDKVNSIINCHLATGRIGRSGMGPFSVTGQPNAMGGREVGGLANMLAAHMNLEDASHRDIVQNFWQSPEIADKPGLKAVDMFQAVDDGRIKAIWIMATNPVDSMPDADKVREALNNCPFVVVSDVLELTDTTQCADVKLPSLAWGEKDGTVTNSERRISRQRGILSSPGKTKADWWQMAEVAKRMGYVDGFNYAHASDVFAEFARLSGVENDGQRDFDISAYDEIGPEDYDQLLPFQWPQAKGTPRSETRFFANGNFYTPDRKANFVPTQALQNQANSKKFILNSGRVRDHWHTMTRTGKSARLSSHMGEPFCEIHPHDAKRLKIEPASLIKVHADGREIIVRALISDRQKLGSIFVPMHWTDQFASNARVDKLVSPRPDPVSGQPALKSMPVNVQPHNVGLFGFFLTRQKPTFEQGEDYWSLAQIDNGWKVEFALQNKSDLASFIDVSFDLALNQSDVSYRDSRSGALRNVWFSGDQLKAILYTDDQPVAVSRSWVIEQFDIKIQSENERYKMSAGRPADNLPDKGAIVCSCFNVGANEIASAIMSGNSSIQAVGQATNAGTNCGSCRAEINGLINENCILAAE